MKLFRLGNVPVVDDDCAFILSFSAVFNCSKHTSIVINDSSSYPRHSRTLSSAPDSLDVRSSDRLIFSRLILLKTSLK